MNRHFTETYASALFLYILNMTSFALASPPVADSLVLFLNADNVSTITHENRTLVTQWTDQSGHGSHAVQSVVDNMPEIVKDPLSLAKVLRFDTNDHFLIGNQSNPPSDTLNPKTGGFTIMLAALQRPQTSSAQYFIRKGNQFSGDEGWSIWQQNGRLNGRVKGQGANDNDHKGGQRYDFQLDEMFIFFLVLDGSRGWAYYQGTNAAAEGLHGDGSYLGTIDPSDPVRIADGLEGDFAEILIYNRQLSQSELEEVGIYLAGKYYIGTGANYPIETCGQIWGNGNGDPEDFDHNCRVNWQDFVILSQDWMTSGIPET